MAQVFKASWNGVQVVAAKQLHDTGTQRAKLDFLREVTITSCIVICG